MSKLISKRGFSICRGCDSENLVSVLDLGEQLLWSTKFGHKLRGCSQTLPLPWWALAHH
jgi:hypothetical protein